MNNLGRLPTKSFRIKVKRNVKTKNKSAIILGKQYFLFLDTN